MFNKPLLYFQKAKRIIKFFASLKTISRALHKMGWRHVLTKYCQIIRPVNRLKRFIYTCMAKRFGEEYDDAIFVDECTVELKVYNPTNWRKDDLDLIKRFDFFYSSKIKLTGKKILNHKNSLLKINFF